MERCDDSELVFENDIYVITVKVLPEEILRVEAEQKNDGSFWRGDFNSGYIEEITKKTGNSKSFAVFVKMLRSAILQDSDSVFVSLLTYYELEVLKARKTNACQISGEPTNNKRYLILTYVGEFDRVHYPLPLLFEDIPERDNLRRTIQRLKIEMAELKSRLIFRRDNSGSIDFQKDDDEIVQDDSSRFQDEKAILIKEMLVWKHKYKLLASKYDAKKDCQKDIHIWRKRVEQLQEDLRRERSNHKKAIASLAAEKITLLEEVKHCKDSETRSRVRLRESESELEHLKRNTGVATNNNSRRPSPQAKGSRSSSCPTFSFRDHSSASRSTFVEQFIPSGRNTCGTGRSSCSERSTTPPQSVIERLSPHSNSSPGKTWRTTARMTKDGHQVHTAVNIVKVNGYVQKAKRERHGSPGKILKDVKEKLAKYAIMEGLETASDKSSFRSASSGDERVPRAVNTLRHQNSDNCYGIEARIEALQNFLSKSK
ncbi:hypothetical protein SELMODRAFT_427833 [Selaginella moellendorffii]|uniref:Coiled-coil domain-containing protein 61 n=1 Tax=Selaginella moellendorffii TaxID=88036 RepID=D8T0V0_SELML|nr:hypothetical protein SELMODRAFT_427833 [Selaginella moellendorffii]